MAAKATRAGAPKWVETLCHGEAKRKNIATAECQSVLDKHKLEPVLRPSSEARSEKHRRRPLQPSTTADTKPK